MATQAPNHIKYLLATKAIDFSGDTFKIILMQSGFSFDIDSHAEYADVSASELATAYGYTAGGATMSGVSVSEDDTNDRCSVTWANPSWTASGGSLVASGAIIYDDTVANDPIVGYIDFGGDQTTLDTGTFTVANPEVRLS
jgi:hypothetical protein